MKCIDLDIPGWMSKEELAWLHYQAILAESILEVGSWMGRSTHALLTGCSGTVWVVDHFNGSPSELETNHREAKTESIWLKFLVNVGFHKNIQVLAEDSIVASGKFEDGSLDMIFIDGEHTEEASKADIAAWFPKCRRLFCGHDRDIPGVAAALQQLQNVQEGPGSLWFVKKGDSQ